MGFIDEPIEKTANIFKHIFIRKHISGVRYPLTLSSLLHPLTPGSLPAQVRPGTRLFPGSPSNRAAPWDPGTLGSRHVPAVRDARRGLVTRVSQEVPKGLSVPDRPWVPGHPQEAPAGPVGLGSRENVQQVPEVPPALKTMNFNCYCVVILSCTAVCSPRILFFQRQMFLVG